MKKVKEIQFGFILPTVLVLSLTIVTIMVTALMVTSSSYDGNYGDSYQKLADEAAEAGSAYATACLNLMDHDQSWGPAMSRPNLAPNTDCLGANSYPGNQYVYSSSKVRTYFSVGNLDYSADFSAQVSSVGYAQVLRANGTVEKTYSSMQKKIITWPTDISGQMSASGTNRTCAIVTSQVYCWGLNRFGQLGNGLYLGAQTAPTKSTDDPEVTCPCNTDNASIIDSTVPVKVVQESGVMAGKKIKKIFVAQHHSCALSEEGVMYCWGMNNYGQLGRGNTVDSAVPVQVGGALAGKEITDIGGTANTSCAIAETKIYCWGHNNKGQVGRNNTSNAVSPVLVVAGNTATTLPTSYAATKLATSGSRSQLMCAIANNRAYCWGQNDDGSVGDGTDASTAPAGTHKDKLLPTKVSETGGLAGQDVTSISQDGYVSDASGGFAHVCVVANLKVYCWGENNTGQVGDWSNTFRKTPVAVWAGAGGALNGRNVQDVQVGLRHSCARSDGMIYCWGLNNYGQLGNNNNTNQTRAVAVYTQPGMLNGTNVIAVGAGANRSCAVVTDGRTFCWGLNNTGQIGDGTKDNRNIPTESLFLRPIANQYIF